MFTDMEKWAEIRRLVWVEDRSKRSVCREFNIHWSTLQKILGHTEPPGYRQAQPRAKRKIGPFLGVIDEILESDKKVHRQQRHTARRIFERLRHEYGYLWHFTIECGGKPGSAAIGSCDTAVSAVGTVNWPAPSGRPWRLRRSATMPSG